MKQSVTTSTVRAKTSHGLGVVAACLVFAIAIGLAFLIADAKAVKGAGHAPPATSPATPAAPPRGERSTPPTPHALPASPPRHPPPQAPF